MVDIQTTPEAQTAADRREAQIKEYGTYVAAEPIMINGVLAFNPGFAVPISHTEEYPQLLEPNEDGSVPVVTVEEWEARKADKDKRGLHGGPDAHPNPKAGRSLWVAFARAEGANESELVSVADGGLGRDELAAKYGPEQEKPKAKAKKAAESTAN